MKFSLRDTIDNWMRLIRNNLKIRRLGKTQDAKNAKQLLKTILKDSDSAFAVPQSIEKFGFRVDEERPLHLDKSLVMAVANKKYYNGSVELSMFENEPSYPDKKVILLLYYNSKSGNLSVLEYGGTFTDKVSVGIKSRSKSKNVVVDGTKEKRPTPTRISDE